MRYILFLIGNGFDLNLGLKTKFSDVVKKYLEIHEDSDDHNIIAFKKELNNNYRNWSDFEKAMGEYAKIFTTINKEDFTFQIDSFRDVLKRMFSDEETRIDYIGNKEQIFSVFGNCVPRFYEYLSESSKQMMASVISPSNKNSSFQYDFITFNYTNVLDNCINLIKSNKINLRKFTNQMAQQTVSDAFGEVLHIHGTLQKDLILGVDNVTQIMNQDFQKDVKMHWMIKPYVNKELGDYNDTRAKQLINKSDIICIFGMSIGETDKSWWNCIFKWLTSDISHNLVLFYYDKEIDETNPRTKIDCRKDIKNIFFSMVDNIQSNSNTQCENRIHIPLNDTDMFKIDLLFKDKR